MAMTICRECKTAISTTARACPKCGATVPPKTKITTWIIGGFVAIALVPLIFKSASRNTEREIAAATAANVEAARLAAMTPDQRAAEAAAIKAKNDTYSLQLKTAVIGALILKQGMKDPRAFEVTEAIAAPDGSICYDYRAKNSFGAILPSAAIMMPNQKILSRDRDGSRFVNAWNSACTKPGANVTHAAKNAVSLSRD